MPRAGTHPGPGHARTSSINNETASGSQDVTRAGGRKAGAEARCWLGRAAWVRGRERGRPPACPPASLGGCPPAGALPQVDAGLPVAAVRGLGRLPQLCPGARTGKAGPRSSPCCCACAPRPCPLWPLESPGPGGAVWAGTGSPAPPPALAHPASLAHQDSALPSKRCPRETEARGLGGAAGTGWGGARLGAGQARCPCAADSRGAHLCTLLPAVRLLPRPLQLPRGRGQRLLQQAALRVLQGQGLHDGQTGPRERRSPRRGAACSWLPPRSGKGQRPRGGHVPRGWTGSGLCLCPAGGRVTDWPMVGRAGWLADRVDERTVRHLDERWVCVDG